MKNPLLGTDGRLQCPQVAEVEASGESRSRGSGCRTGSTFWTRIKPARLCRELLATLIRRLCSGVHRQCAAKPIQSSLSIKSHPSSTPCNAGHHLSNHQWAGVGCQGRTGTSSGQPKTPIPLRAHCAPRPSTAQSSPPPTPPGATRYKETTPPNRLAPGPLATFFPQRTGSVVDDLSSCFLRPNPERDHHLSPDNRITSKTQHFLHPIASLLDD